VHISFYQALVRIEALSKKPEIIKKIKQLRGTKEYQANTLSNNNGGQEMDAVLPAPLKKRKTNDAISVASSASKGVAIVNFGTVMTDELLIKPVKPLNLPGKLHKYLANKPKPNQDTSEKQVQTWFNGLMKKANTLWESVAAMDTCLNPYLKQFKEILSDLENGLQKTFTILQNG
ncbi:19941_t:CDS:2, partial [Gigaspora margarita]